MLHNWEQLNVGIAEVFDVRDELVSKFVVAKPAITIFRDAPPRAEMDFVDTNGGIQPVFARTFVHPARIRPMVLIDASDHRAVVRAEFGGKGVRIRLERENDVPLANNFEFIDGAFAKFGNEELPDAGRTAKAHRIDAAVPMIEIADDADAAGIRRPNGKMNAGDTIDSFHVGAEFFVGVVMAAFAHEIKIELREKKRERVSVVGLYRFAVLCVETNAIAGRSRREFADARQNGFKETLGSKLAHGKRFGQAFVGQRFGGQSTEKNLRRVRTWLEKTYRPAASFGRVERMRSENAERIGIAGH